jgi:hypothetical protein
MDPDPTRDPTPFFSDFKDAKKIFFSSYTLPAGTLSSVLKLNFLLKILCYASIISAAQHLMRKWKDPDPDRYLWLFYWIRIREAQKHADTNPDPAFFFTELETSAAA